MFVNGPTGLDLAAIVDPAIRRAWIQSVGPVTFSDTTNHGVLFQNNVKALFGTSSPQSSIYQDGTDLVIQPQEVGSTAVVKFGASSDKNIQLNKIGLGTTAVSALNWIAFNQTASTGRGNPHCSVCALFNVVPFAENASLYVCVKESTPAGSTQPCIN